MKKKALIVLAEGFEEIEAMTPADILRRAGIDVILAGLDGISVKGAHGVIVNADTILEQRDILPDAVVFPGGYGGAERLSISSRVKNLIGSMNEKRKLIAAICASPAMVLAPTGVLDGKKATCYPSMEENFSQEVEHTGEAVVRDGNIITSMGPATALAFSLKIAEALVGKDIADMVAREVLVIGRE